MKNKQDIKIEKNTNLDVEKTEIHSANIRGCSNRLSKEETLEEVCRARDWSQTNQR